MTQTIDTSPTPYIQERTMTPNHVQPEVLRTPLNAVGSTSIPPTNTPSSEDDAACLDVEMRSDFRLQESGEIVYSLYPWSRGAGLFNIETKEKTPLQVDNEQITTNYSVSTQGDWLAGEIFRKELIVFSANGSVYKRIPWKEKWQGIFRWLDDENLLMHLPRQPGTNGTLELYNPFTEEYRILASDFPNIYPHSMNGLMENPSLVIYSPGLLYAIYPTQDHGLVLWDIKKGKEITRLEMDKYGDLLYQTPKWSPDGKQVVVIGEDSDFILINADGKVEKLGVINQLFSQISYLSWSPDSRHIAFWWNHGSLINNIDEYLAVLDVNSRHIRQYCIHPAYDPGDLVNPPLPTWSPDSQWIAVQSVIKENQKHMVVVSIQQNVAVKLFDNLIPFGWLKKSN